VSETAAPSPSARLIAAAPALAGCVRAFIERDTVGAALQPEDRFNHFPASPLCAISWFLQGSATLDGQPLPGPIVFRGPQSMPTITANPGPVRVFLLLLMPDALAALTGLDIADHADRFSDARQVFTESDWAALLNGVMQAPDTAARVELLHAFLAPRWQEARSGRHAGSGRDGRVIATWHYADWTRALALQAALSAPGRSLRQAQRRIRGWAGLPLQRLESLSRAERSFLDAMQQQARGRVDWADVAAGAGYADQAHLCRAARQASGESPAQLLERMRREECFWVYRLWAG
jgi:AraC-like DNA-binding protein